MLRRAFSVLGITVAVLASSAGVASADPTAGSSADNVWSHGGSNMGECSAYLAQLEVPGVNNVRAEVNQIIKDYGAYLEIASPGALYSVRARQQVNRAPVDECLARQLPGGATG